MFSLYFTKFTPVQIKSKQFASLAKIHVETIARARSLDKTTATKRSTAIHTWLNYSRDSSAYQSPRTIDSRRQGFRDNCWWKHEIGNRHIHDKVIYYVPPFHALVHNSNSASISNRDNIIGACRVLRVACRVSRVNCRGSRVNCRGSRKLSRVRKIELLFNN